MFVRGSGPGRIVCLTEETTEILYLLGEQDRIVGISAYTVRPPEARDQKPVVSAFIGGSVSKIKALRPDLVIGFSDVQASLARDLISENLQVLILNQRSIQEILNVILLVGSLVCRRDGATRLVDKICAHLDAVRDRAARRSTRPRVYFEEWDEPMITGIRWVSEIIGLTGGLDVFEDRSTGLKASERTVRPDEVLAAQPDVMLASWCGKPFDAEAVRARPGFDGLPAFVNGRVHEVPSEVILQPGPASLTDGVRLIESLLFPGS